MRNLISVMVSIALLVGFSACEKEEIYKTPSWTSGQSTTTTGSYTWPGQARTTQPESLGKSAVSGWANVYDYKFRIHLDGSQVDPNPLILSEFGIPHVGPGGVLIYNNVANDATYIINKIEGGYVYYTIRSEAGHTLKYNLARKVGNNQWIWWLVIQVDDGINNIISFKAY